VTLPTTTSTSNRCWDDARTSAVAEQPQDRAAARLDRPRFFCGDHAQVRDAQMTQPTENRGKANRKLMGRLLVVVAVMFGFGFALVPFYEEICEVTGMRNVFQPDAAAARSTQVDATSNVSVEW